MFGARSQLEDTITKMLRVLWVRRGAARWRGPAARRHVPSRDLCNSADRHDNVIVAPVPGKGLGVLAARRFDKGALVLEESAFARVSKDTTAAAQTDARAATLMQRVYELAATGTFSPQDRESWPAEVVDCLEQVLDIQAEEVYNRLPPESQAKWMALQFVPLSAGGSQPTPGRLLRTNGFDDAEGFANLYELTARMNHSCLPNTVRVSGDAASQQVRIVAVRQIRAGEEVSVSYLDTEAAGSSGGMPVRQRREYLMKNFGFRCMCLLCRRESAPPPLMTNRTA